MPEPAAVKLPDLHHERYCQKPADWPVVRIEQYRQTFDDGRTVLCTRCRECGVIRYDPI